MFSAPFGAGKSTFLNIFFKKHADKYVMLNLNPVNYSVSSNEDIFELIKYDIIAQLLESFPNELNLDETDYPFLWLLQNFVESKLDIYRITKAFLNATSIPGVDKSLGIVDVAEESVEKFYRYNKEINKTEKSKFDTYLATFEKNKGSIYESDDITRLISSFIERIRIKNPRK